MKTYRVWAKMTTYCYIDIEEENASYAMAEAEKIDGGEFIPDDSLGEWDILSADELEDGKE